MSSSDPWELDFQAFSHNPQALAELLQGLLSSYNEAKNKIFEVKDIIDNGLRMLTDGYGAEPSSFPFSIPDANPGGLMAQEDYSQAEIAGENPGRAELAGTLQGNYDDATALKIFCLGKFSVQRGGEAVTGWRNGKAKGILKLLVIQFGKPLPKDVFMEALWPEASARSANNSFHVAMSELRQKLGGSQKKRPDSHYVVAQGGNYSLNTELPIWIDVEEFPKYCREGRFLESQGRSEEAMGLYQRAEDLYGGDFLEEDLYEEWTLFKRESLLDMYLGILSKLVGHCLRTERLESCIELSQKILARDRSREDAYRNLMWCHYKLGQRSRALNWYKLCQQVLRRELDSPVSPKTLELCRKLFSEECAGRTG